MEYKILGYPPDGPTLELDYREFAYAGKFVMSNTGKSIVTESDEILGAVAFNADHDDPQTGHLRYVTVQEGRRGDGIGRRLLRYTAEMLQGDLYETVVIAVNNPVAYRACYRAGFTYTGQEAGIAELVLRYDPSEDRSEQQYQDGLMLFEERDLPPEQQTVLELTGFPSIVDVPKSSDGG
jgi:GNAT superfamily N-acetyltransferase